MVTSENISEAKQLVNALQKIQYGGNHDWARIKIRRWNGNRLTTHLIKCFHFSCGFIFSSLYLFCWLGLFVSTISCHVSPLWIVCWMHFLFVPPDSFGRTEPTIHNFYSLIFMARFVVYDQAKKWVFGLFWLIFAKMADFSKCLRPSKWNEPDFDYSDPRMTFLKKIFCSC